MSLGNIHLTDLQKDALTELFNMGIGAAADSLSKMVNSEIQLSIPKLIVSSTANLPSQPIIATRQIFYGRFRHLNYFVIFPRKNIYPLAKHLFQNNITIDEEIGQFEKEAILETSNLILNSCLGTVSRQLQSEFRSDKPVILSGLLNNVLSGGEDGICIKMQLHFQAENETIHGEIYIHTSSESIKALQNTLIQFLARI